MNRRVTRNMITETTAYGGLSKMLQNITRNRNNVKAIENGFNVAMAKGYEAWVSVTQSNYANREIIKELYDANSQ